MVHSWVYVGAKGEGYEVVELRVQRWVGRGGLEKGWCGLGRCEVGKKEALREGGGGMA